MSVKIGGDDRVRAYRLVQRKWALGAFAAALLAGTAPAYAADAVKPRADQADVGKAATEKADKEASGAQVQDVVVTARKRKERSQEVPIAMTVIGKQQLQDHQISNVRQLFQEVPTLQVIIPNSRNASLNIRGIGSSLANDGLTSPVGVFVDGVYYARPGAATFDLIDLERVEVLRGPQGTLFGKNTIAGALNISTLAPSFTPSTTAEASIGSYFYKQFRGTTTGPIGDQWAYRASASWTRRDGFLTNVRTGQDLNDYKDISLRAQAYYVPNTDFNFRLIADYDKQHINCCNSTGIKDIISTTSSGTPFPNGFAQRAAKLGYKPTFGATSNETDIDSPQNIVTHQQGISGTANWNIWDGYTLSSITAYRQWAFDPNNDFDFIGLPVLTNNDTNSHQEQFSQEVRLSSPGGRKFEYVLGLYYFWELIQSTNDTTLGSSAWGWISQGSTALASAGKTLGDAALTGLTQLQHAEPKTSSYAGYGQGTYHVTDALDVTAGLRYTYEKKSVNLVQYNVLPAVPSSLTALTPILRLIQNSVLTSGTFSQDYSEGNPSGTVSAAYKFTPNVLGYASYSRGYQSGGVNVGLVAKGLSQTVDPETANAYELGVKSEWFKKRLQVNLAAYLQDINDYQATTVVNTATSSNSYIANVGKVTSKGLELDAKALPFKNLLLTASGAYTDAILDSYTNAPCPPETLASSCDLSGTQAPGSSKWAAYTSATYSHKLDDWGPRELIGYVSADYSYRSQFQNGANSTYQWAPGYGIADLTLGVRFDDKSWDLSVWGHNLFDKVYYTAIGSLAFNVGATTGFRGDPRMIGLTLRHTF